MVTCIYMTIIGNVTIFPKASLFDYLSLLDNPSEDYLFRVLPMSEERVYNSNNYPKLYKL